MILAEYFTGSANNNYHRLARSTSAWMNKISYNFFSLFQQKKPYLRASNRCFLRSPRPIRRVSSFHEILAQDETPARWVMSESMRGIKLRIQLHPFRSMRRLQNRVIHVDDFPGGSWSEHPTPPFWLIWRGNNCCNVSIFGHYETNLFWNDEAQLRLESRETFDWLFTFGRLGCKHPSRKCTRKHRRGTKAKDKRCESNNSIKAMWKAHRKIGITSPKLTLPKFAFAAPKVKKVERIQCQESSWCDDAPG